ncbi:MAG: IS1380 family transposase [Candidatus Woesearchaeota archaeon]
MKKINYFKLIAKENFQIDSSIGIYPVCAFIQNSGLYEAIRKAAGFSKGKSGTKQTNLIIASILAIIDGVTNIEQMPSFLEKNKRFAKELGINKIPSKSTIYKLFERVNKDNRFVKKLKANMQNWLINNYICHKKGIMADIDATFMNTDKEIGTINYKGEKSLSALLMHIGNEKLIWDFEIRDGSTHAGYGINKMVENFLNKTADLEKQRTIRSDSAGYNGKLINICEKHSSFFIIKVAKHCDFTQMQYINKFETYKDKDGKAIEIRNFVHTMNNTKPFRIVAYKYEIAGELFSEEGYIATNIENKNGYEINLIYRSRATQEQAIEELKNHLAFNYVPSNNMDINNMFYAICIVGYNVISLLEFLIREKGIKIDYEITKRNIKANTFRYYFIHLAGKIVKTARRIYIYITKLEEKWLKVLESFWNSCYGFGQYYPIKT